MEPFFQANELTHPSFLIFLIALICLVSVVIPKKIFRLPLFTVISLLSFHYYFPAREQIYGEWGWGFLQDLQSELAVYSLSNSSYIPERMALCLLLILVILLSGLLIDYNNCFIPYSMAIGYLLVLEVYTDLDVFLRVITITAVIFAFILLRKDGLQKRGFVVKGLVVLLLSLGLAKIYPTTFESSHNKLVSLSVPIRAHLNSGGFYNRIQQHGVRMARSSGFSDHDRHLGGPLFDNNEVAFTAYQETGHYWRVETKHIYTGDGWEGYRQGNLSSIQELPYEISSVFYYQNNDDQFNEAQIELEASATFIPLPYGQVLLTSGSEDRQIRSEDLSHDHLNDRLHLMQRGPNLRNQIHIASTMSEPTPEALRNVNFNNTGLENLSEYLQLPTLPVRISELALEITEDIDGLYDQVIAIESFLRNGDFRYSKIDTPFTPVGRDYVDYFLFESGVGYCDNFSTSMVVLLRTLGIPARWTKGFTQGNQIELADRDYNQFTVLNRHAHSWVEVFFPGIGWVPFEPTPSFNLSDDTDRIEDVSTPEPELEEDQLEEDQFEEDQFEDVLSDFDDDTLISNDSESEVENGSTVSWDSIILRVIGIFLAIAGVVLVIFIYKNVHWLGFVLYLQFLAQDFEGTYGRLLKAYRFFEVRLPGESLIEYAKRVKHKSITSSDSFLVLTKRYEESLYGNKKINLTEHKPLFIEAVAVLYKKLK